MRKRWMIAATILLSSGTAHAVETLDVGADPASCTVYRRVVPGDAPTLVGVRHYPGAAGVVLLLSVPSSMMLEPDRMRPAFDADHLSVGAIERARNAAGRTIYFIPLEPRSGTTLGDKGTISLTGVTSASIPVDLGQVARMVRAGGECETGLLSGWGVEPSGPMSVAQPAVARGGQWISVADVPERYLRRVNDRFTTILWTIGDDGRVGETCRVIEPSGDEGLDQLACPTLRRKISYRQPARDAAGQPVESVMVRRIRWGPIE
ncbi:hypothetical protein [Sphingomonas sp. IW22]|uniref:hypothetical protein n=1 Tax=Sphingomonas sp. IW22 TaxID=3242489 RepID=UPI00351F8E47